MFNVGPTELLLILGICALLFGAKRLPGIGAGMGEAIRNFRGALRAPPEEPAVAPRTSADSSAVPAPRS
jgi:sec-independent protein translocase protein TatA